MSKAKEKEKVEESRKNKSSVGERLFQREGTPESESAEMAERRAVWKSAIETLLTRDFSNIDQAVTAIVDEVLKKMVIPGMPEAQVREFLHTLIDTDPMMKEELRSSLKIKG